MHLTARTDERASHDDHVGADLDSLGQYDLRTDRGQGTDLDAIRQLRAGIDHRARMNQRHAWLSPSR